MGDVQGMVGGAMNKLGQLSTQGGTRHMCYLVLFFVGVFIFLYFILGRTSSAAPASSDI